MLKLNEIGNKAYDIGQVWIPSNKVIRIVIQYNMNGR